MISNFFSNKFTIKLSATGLGNRQLVGLLTGHLCNQIVSLKQSVENLLRGIKLIHIACKFMGLGRSKFLSTADKN